MADARAKTADALIRAKQFYLDAAQEYERKRSLWTRRVLRHAQKQLERAEFVARLASSRPAYVCTDCGWTAVAERWADNTDVERETFEGQVRVRAVRHDPQWASRVAVQGVTQVTRYVCPECDRVFGVVGLNP